MFSCHRITSGRLKTPSWKAKAAVIFWTEYCSVPPNNALQSGMIRRLATFSFHVSPFYNVLQLPRCCHAPPALLRLQRQGTAASITSCDAHDLVTCFHTAKLASWENVPSSHHFHHKKACNGDLVSPVSCLPRLFTACFDFAPFLFLMRALAPPF